MLAIVTFRRGDVGPSRRRHEAEVMSSRVEEGVAPVDEDEDEAERRRMRARQRRMELEMQETQADEDEAVDQNEVPVTLFVKFCFLHDFYETAV